MTRAAPASGSTASHTIGKDGKLYDTCASVTKNFLNAHNCSIVDTCAPTTHSSAYFELNATSMRTWYVAGGGKYVYEIRGLRLDGEYDVGPCDGPSRIYKRSWCDGSCASARQRTVTKSLTRH